VGLFAQIQAFLLTFFLGIVAGLIFHYYQLTIRSLRIGKYILYLMDFILWIIMIIIIAAALLVINQGEMRVYVFIALIAGGAVYYKCLSQYLHQPVYILGKSTAYFLKKQVSYIAKPFVLVTAWLKVQYRKRQMSPPPTDGPLE
jgi:spore cortex biosynthesis protein YabQ